MSIEHQRHRENRQRRPLQPRLSTVVLGATIVFGLQIFLAPAVSRAAVIQADESNYQDLVKRLQPGDELQLRPGIYRANLRVRALHGRPGAPIVISGAENGPPTIFVARARANTIEIVDSSYVTVRNLVLEGRGLNADGVKCPPGSRGTHHIVIENMAIRGYGGSQQIVGISTKCPAWSWEVRNNTIVGAGTGMYFGDSDGSAPFVGGLIESNVVVDSLGYNLQVKHQAGREGIPDLPDAPTQTVIRHNTFVKAHNGAGSPLARPNVLLGHFPRTGAGSRDRYLVYGNFFYQNPTERLLQAEGNVAVYNNLFVNDGGDAIAIQPHNDIPRRVWIFHNTVLARDGGILFTAAPDTEVQEVIANAVFAAQPLSGGAQRGNVTGTRAEAEQQLHAASSSAPLNLHPEQPLATDSSPAELLNEFPGAGCDFDGRRRDRAAAGAYIDSGSPRAWQPTIDGAPTMYVCDR